MNINDILNKYIFSSDKLWFLNNFETLHSTILNYVNPLYKIDVLEIGSFEGLSTVFFSELFLKNNESTLTCVDPFFNIKDNDHLEVMDKLTEKKFDYNMLHNPYNKQIYVNKITSDNFFINNKNLYDFIYIDGCHIPEYIDRDMRNSFSCLKKYGIMWMDDYAANTDIMKVMHKFLEDYNGSYIIIHIGYQIALQKIKL
jgi:hypothetical protein